MKSFRIDPANGSGIHVIDVKNGGERVFIPKKEIDDFISDLVNVRGEV